MHNEVARTLKSLLDEYGPGLYENPKRCRALLLDFCGKYKREINVLIMALQKGVPTSLQSSSDATLGLVQKSLSRKLYDDLGLAEDISFWAVQTWSYALGLTSTEPDPLHHDLNVKEEKAVVTPPEEGKNADLSLQSSPLLEKIVRPELRATFRGHQSPILSVAFSPDGSILASSGQDQTIRLWETRSSTPLNVLHGHKGYVESVAFTPDGKLLASASGDYSVRIWDISSAEEISALRSHGAWVFDVAFSPNGKFLASASWNKTIRIWDLFSGMKPLVLRGHKNWVYSIAFSPNGNSLASAGKDGTVRLWDILSGEQLLVLAGHKSEVSCVAFSPDGKTIASAGNDRTVRLWDAVTGEQLDLLYGHKKPVTSLAFAPTSKIITTGGRDNIILFWNLATGEEICSLSDHDRAVTALSFSPDGRYFASGGYDHIVRLWSVESMLQQMLSIEARKTLFLNKRKPEPGNLFDYEGASSKDSDHRTENNIEFEDVKTSETKSSSDKTESADTVAKKYRDLHELSVLRGHRNWVWSVAFSPDGQTLASGSRDKTVCLWDISSSGTQDDLPHLNDAPIGKKLLDLSGHKKPVFSVAFSADGKTLASGSLDKTVRLWEVSSGKELAVLRLHEYMDGEVLSVAFSSNGRTLASGGMDKTIRLWDTSAITKRSVLGRLMLRISGKKHQVLRNHDNPVLSVAFSPDGKTLASGSADRTVRVWDASSGAELFVLYGHQDWVSSVVYGPDEKTIASAGYDHTIRLWDTVSREEILVLRGHTSRVHSTSFSPDGKILASSSMDKTIRLWNTVSGEELAVLYGHGDYVVPVAFSPRGNLLASGSYDKTIRLWQVLTRDNMFYKLGNSFSLGK